MRIIYINFALFIITFAVCAQDSNIQDTLVNLNEITFHSELEKEAFNDFFKGNQECYLKLFFAKQESISNQVFLSKASSLEKYISLLKEDKNYSKAEKKKVKYYYQEIHNKYLVKYELNTFFPQIFENGYYNCVTGSILFSLIFKELNIPFTIKVSPIHAYIVAYPNTESILVETTNPIKGYFVFSQAFKDDYVKHLRDNKLISIQEYNTSTIDVLFEKYYFKEKDVTLKELVGIQYYNDAIAKIQEQNFEDAFYELEKAYLFYPSDEIAYLLYFSGMYVLEKQDYSNIKYIDFLYKIARYKRFGINKEQIIGEFGEITQTQLGYKGKYELYDTIYKKLYYNLNDKVTKEEISFIYNYELARLYIRNNRLNSSFPYIEEALKIRPEHLDLQTMLIYVISDKYRYVDLTEDDLNELNNYGVSFPKLKENKAYTDMICDAYLFCAVQNYENGNITKAIKYHEKFNQIATDINSYSNFENNVPRLYSSAAVYYFRKGYNNKSKSVLLEGLKLVPNSYELKQRLKLFN